MWLSELFCRYRSHVSKLFTRQRIKRKWGNYSQPFRPLICRYGRPLRYGWSQVRHHRERFCRISITRGN
ncbi:ORF1080 [White spot syndrome virus]|uniref:ORF1080 n=1 Tax=White spot syndrome virus TaxID=342409 RepID=A0A2D3I6K6_9VIRU|nr:ORF1080 [White spot syndrome virus]